MHKQSITTELDEKNTLVPFRQYQGTHGNGSTVMEFRRPALSPVVSRVTVLREKNT